MNWRLSNRYLLWIPMILLVMVMLFLLYNAMVPEEMTITGEIDGRQIDVAFKVPGRIDTIWVREGQKVMKGDTLARIISPELEAKYEQARAAVKSAKAMLDMAMNGARDQEIKALFELFQAARSQYEFAEKSWQRIQKLYQDSIISKQMYDEAEYKYNAAKAQMIAAEQKWKLAVEGARKEQIDAAYGQYERALGAMKEVESFLSETVLVAPINGEVDNILVDPGELVATGYPVISLMDRSSLWLSVYVPEERLPIFQEGKKVLATIPALDPDQEFPFEIYYIQVTGSYATRKASHEKGDFDHRTYEVRMKPVQNLEQLRQGMTAIVFVK